MLIGPRSKTLSPRERRKARQAIREAAHKSLLSFTTYTFPEYNAEPAHRLLAETLDQVVAGEIKRLMVWWPPQHGKSELCSLRLPAYWLGRRPDDPIILTSYGADLAYSFSRKARNLVESPEYRRLFRQVRTAGDSRAVNEWSVAGHRGGLLAAGVGGPITGHGAALGIIDDPIENWKQAQSEVIRRACQEWYGSTFLTRIWEDGAIVLVMTRWHEDDLAGYILRTEPGKWRVLRFPALAETPEERAEANRRLGLDDQADPLKRQPGEALCPALFSAETLEARAPLIPGWSGIGQQNPMPATGQRLDRSWFSILEAAPAITGQRIRFWDLADSLTGKRTAGVRMAQAGALWIVEHVVCGHWLDAERDAVIRQTAEADGRAVPVWIEQEPGSGGKAQVAAIVRLLAGFNVQGETASGDKDVRLAPFAAQAGAGNVRLVQGDWNMAYIDEMCAVPHGKYRDQADATAGAFNKLAGRIDYGPPGVSQYA